MSASTDSTLRLWDVTSQQLSRMYRSHLNEKNFVGLSVEGDFLACGSETGEVCYIAGLFFCELLCCRRFCIVFRVLFNILGKPLHCTIKMQCYSKRRASVRVHALSL